MNTDNVIENIDQNVQEIGELAGIQPSDVTAEPANTDFFVENIDKNVKAIAKTLDVTPYEVETDPANTDFFVENIAKNVDLIKDNFSGGGDVTIEALTVTENGTYQEEGKAYSPVNVNVQSLGIPREVNANGVYRAPTESFSFVMPSEAKSIAPYALAYAFYNATGLTSVDMSSVTSIASDSSLASAFQGCSSLQSVDLSSLKLISGSYTLSNAFRGCTSLSNVNFTSLETIDGVTLRDVFYGCTSLPTLNFPSLFDLTNANSVFYSAFRGCTSLKNIYFPALKSSSFGPYSSQFDGIVYGLDGCTLHFPSSIQALIEGMSGYPNFGGTNTTVLFDL